MLKNTGASSAEYDCKRFGSLPPRMENLFGSILYTGMRGYFGWYLKVRAKATLKLFKA